MAEAKKRAEYGATLGSRDGWWSQWRLTRGARFRYPRLSVAPGTCRRLRGVWSDPPPPAPAGCWMFEVKRSAKEGDVPVTTAFNRMLGLPGAWVRDVAFGAEGVIVTVVLSAKNPVARAAARAG